VIDKIKWDEYNEPPFLPQWMCEGETLELARYDDELKDDIQDQFSAIIEQYDIENAEGIQLDRIGKIFAEPRKGNTDETYRKLLKLRILLNTCTGTVNDIIKVIKFIYSSEIVHIVPNYPAALTILHDGSQEYIDYNRILVQVIGAGIGYDTNELFRFSDYVEMAEQQQITLKSKFTDDFSRAGKIYHNGRILRDGKTILDTEIRATAYRNGMHIRDGSFFHAKTYARLPATDVISLPLLHGSGMRESFSIAINSGACEDRQFAPLYRNGSIRRDGAEYHRPHGNNFAYDTLKIWQRKHHFHNGDYRRDGQINHDGMILLPLAI